MSLLVNLRLIERKSLRLEGELPAELLGLGQVDELIQAPQPLAFDLEVEKQGASLYVHGRIEVELECECARCLRRFRHRVCLDPYDLWVPLEGEESAVAGDFVDLTPWVREDTLLGFPQRPLCGTDCQGLPGVVVDAGGAGGEKSNSGSAWSELDRLDL
jgi:uncharacterized protein